MKNQETQTKEVFSYMGIEITLFTHGTNEPGRQRYTSEAVIKDNQKAFTSTTKKQSKDMIKKAIRKSYK